MLALLLSYTFLVPIYRNPDEPYHVDLVLHMRQTINYPDFNERFVSQQVIRSYKAARYRRNPPWYGRSLADQALPRDRRPSYEQLGPDVPSSAVNHVANHPFLYYLLIGKSLALIAKVWPGADRWSYDQTVTIMRLLTLALVVPLPLLTFAAARRFGVSPAQCLAAALFPVANPQMIREGSSVNNDALLILLAAVLTLLLARVWTGDRSAGTAALVGVTLGLALLTKGFALALVPWVGLAYARSWWRGPRRPALIGAMLALGLAAVLGGWWWLRNVLVFGAIQTGLPHTPRRYELDPTGWAKIFAWRMTASFWGYFGQNSVALHLAAILAPILLATALTVVAVAMSLRARNGRWTPAATPFLLWPMAGILVIVVQGAWSTYVSTRITCCAQGRYLMSGMPALAVVMVVGWGLLLGRRERLLPVGMLALAALLHGVAVLSLLNLYWGPLNPTIRESVDALLAWTPWRARTVAALLAVCASVVALLALRLVVATIRAGPDRTAIRLGLGGSPGSASGAPGRLRPGDVGLGGVSRTGSPDQQDAQPPSDVADREQ